MHPDDPLTTSEAADLLGVTRQTVNVYIDRGLLPVTKTPGGHARIRRADLLTFQAQPPGTPGSTAEQRVLVFANQKGGVGKTTMTVNLAVLLAQAGLRVLVIDLDPQGHATFTLGVNPEGCSYTIYDALLHSDQVEPDRLIQATRFGVDLAPINLTASEAETELSRLMTWGTCLKTVIAALQDRYDVILIDTGPHLDKLLANALVAARWVIIPTQLEMLSVRGFGMLRARIAEAGKVNRRLEIAGVAPVMVQPVRADREIEEALRGTVPDVRIFRQKIARSTAFKDVASANDVMARKHPTGEYTAQYRRLLGELVAVMDDPLLRAAVAHLAAPDLAVAAG